MELKITKKHLAFALLFFSCTAHADQPAFTSTAQPSKSNPSRQAHPPQEQTELVTNQLIRFFDQTVQDGIVGAEDLELVLSHLREKNMLINPVSEHVRDQSVVNLVKYNAFGSLVKKIEQNKITPDYARIKTWLAEKIKALEQNARDRERMHEETRELHIPMRFAEIPAGKYIDAIENENGEEFTIPAGFEILTTPVTQHQYASVMGDNPSTYRETVSAGDFVEDVAINTQFVQKKKIKMRTNAPIETVSYAQIQEFINRLNAEAEKNGQDYVYALPSVAEYQALLQATLGADWLEKLKKMRACREVRIGSDNKGTCPVDAGNYLDLKETRNRIWGVIGNVWQRTRDRVYEVPQCVRDDMHYMRRNCDESEKQVAENLIFGTSFVTDPVALNSAKTLFRAVPIERDCEKTVGFRLVRFKKHAVSEPASKTYSWQRFNWNEDVAEQDYLWHWNDEKQKLCFSDFVHIIKHTHAYPEAMRHTVKVLSQETYFYGGDFVDHLRGIDRAYLFDKHISDLTPFIGLNSVINIYLGHRPIRNMGPLAALTQLEELNLSDTKPKNLAFLGRLTRLLKLDLCRNEIHDLGFLASLTRLRELVLDSNKITDIKSLAGLTGLEKLSLADNEITDITSLAGLKLMKDLNLGFNPIENIAPLAQLNLLERLGIFGNRIQDLTPLMKLTHLTELYLSYNKISDWAQLSQLSRLKTLALHQNEIDNVSFLAPLMQLEKLDLSLNNIYDAGPLARLKRLKNLDLGFNEINNLAFLASLTDLEELKLPSNRINALDQIAELKKLKTLYLSNNQVRDVTPLKDLNGLEWLDLSKNQVHDLKPLRALNRLIGLYIYGNPIEDLTPLAQLTQDVTICLDKDQIGRLKPQIDALPKNIEVREWAI